MAKTAVDRIVQQILALSPEEQEQVRQRIGQPPAAGALTDEEKRKRLFEELYAEGLIDKIPSRSRRLAALNHPPVKITGKPLSETIIEERR